MFRQVQSTAKNVKTGHNEIAPATPKPFACRVLHEYRRANQRRQLKALSFLSPTKIQHQLNYFRENGKSAHCSEAPRVIGRSALATLRMRDCIQYAILSCQAFLSLPSTGPLAVTKPTHRQSVSSKIRSLESSITFRLCFAPIRGNRAIHTVGLLLLLDSKVRLLQ